MNLLPRFYDVQSGAVRVLGADVRSVSQLELRRRVGIVMQDVFLFATDIVGNISLRADDISRARVEQAAAVVGADEFIERLATIRDVDRICVMRHGEIVEVGRHHDLLLCNVLNSKLWRMQFDHDVVL